MENEIIDFKNESPNSPLTISSGAATYLKETAGWGKFLAIIGFIFTGLIIIAGFFVGSLLASVGQETPLGGFIGVIYIALGVLYFFPALYLFKYSTKLKNAIATKNNEELATAFENEKSMFKFMGILTILMLGLYALAFIGGTAAALFS